MAEVGIVEQLARWSCGLATMVFIFIATFSRSEQLEMRAQRFLGLVCIVAAASQAWLALNGDTFFGSANLPTALALVCVIVAIGANLNIKGKDLSQGMNPHQIMRMIREEE